MVQFQEAGNAWVLCDIKAKGDVCHPGHTYQLSSSSKWLVRIHPHKRTHTSLFASLSLPFISQSSPCDVGTPEDYSEGRIVNGFELLPVAVKQGGKLQRYVWDGQSIKSINEELLDHYTAAGRFTDAIERWRASLHEAFLPKEKDVSADYWEWLPWRLTQRFFSTVTLNFATQSLLMAVGVGAKKALAASAAINWMLKDGMGRIVRMTVATQFGQSFDSDLKRLRFLTSILHTTCITCEFMTPFFPQHFLLLASVANVGKAVGLTTFVSTQPAFMQALCNGGNLADLSAKTQAQHMVMDTLALAVCSTLTYIFRNNDRGRMLLPVIAFPLCSLGDLYGIYHELKAVQLRSLNRERAEMVAEQWVKSRVVPTARQISSAESLLVESNVDNGFLPMRIGPLEGVVDNPQHLHTLLRQYKRQQYLLSVREGHPGLWSRWSRVGRPHVAVTFSDEADSLDILTAVLQVAYLRRELKDAIARKGTGSSGPTGWRFWRRRRADVGESMPRVPGDGEMEEVKREVMGAFKNGWSGPCLDLSWRHSLVDISSLTAQERDNALLISRRRAQKHLGGFVTALEEMGWHTKPFLLSTVEKAAYVRLKERS